MESVLSAFLCKILPDKGIGEGVFIIDSDPLMFVCMESYEEIQLGEVQENG